jgi:hypothetical protein
LGYAYQSEYIGKSKKHIQYGSSQFYVKANTATDFLRQVGEHLSKITAFSIDREKKFDLTGVGKEEYSEISRQAVERIEDYEVATITLAQELFCSALAVHWNCGDAKENEFLPSMAEVISLKFANNLRKLRGCFLDSMSDWYECPFDDDELCRIIQWNKEVHSYSDLKKIYYKELNFLTEYESEILLNMTYYKLNDKRDKDFEARLKVIDQDAGKKSFFHTLMRTEGFYDYPAFMLQLLIEGEFRDVQDILLISPAQLLYIPSAKQAMVLCDREDLPNVNWFDANNYNGPQKLDSVLSSV